MLVHQYRGALSSAIYTGGFLYRVIFNAILPQIFRDKLPVTIPVPAARLTRPRRVQKERCKITLKMTRDFSLIGPVRFGLP
jgi:hypothetical protein